MAKIIKILKESKLRSDQLPDVDVDYSSIRKDDVKRYLESKYGENYVASVGTFTRLKLKGILKDFARVNTSFTPSQMNFLTKKIDDQLDYKFEDLFKYAQQSIELAKFIQENFKLINQLKNVMGQPKTNSIHASAVLIVPRKDINGERKDIFEWVPVRKILDKKTNQYVLVSEWEGKYIDRAGFLKEDLLGLNLLDKFDMILKLIKNHRKEDIILEKIPMNDKEVFKIFAQGFNEEVFQFSTGGLKNYCKFVKPDSMEDLIAMNALFRPGPMKSNSHILYGEIKHGKKEPEFDYMLEEITKKTHGLFVYQEQIIQAVHILGGFSLSEADRIRSMIKHFKKEEFLEFEKKFISGALKNGCEKNEAKKIWKKLLFFSGYGYNRSHSASYSIMSYWCQYLKCYYPEEFYCVSFNYNKPEDIPALINEIKKRNLDLTLSPPDINYSKGTFTCDVESHVIYWSLKSIKGVGEAIVKCIVRERKQNGEFKGLKNFINRMKGKHCGKNIVEVLILSGAFDNLYEIEEAADRFELLESLHKITGDLITKEQQSYYSKGFNFLRKQRELTGFGILCFPEIIKKKSKKLAGMFINSEDFFDVEKDYKRASVAGEILTLVERKTKKGKFGSMRILSNYEQILITIWSDEWKEYKKKLEEAKKNKDLITISGKIKYDNYNKQNVLYSNNNTEIYIL